MLCGWGCPEPLHCHGPLLRLPAPLSNVAHVQPLQGPVLDYAKLKKRYRDVEGTRERQKLDSEFRADIEERGAQLARLAPNLKAMEQYEAVKASSEMGMGFQF